MDQKDPHSIFTAELERVPQRVRKFLGRDRAASQYDRTWENFAGAYADAFEALANAGAVKDSPKRLTPPLFYLCRHAIELEIKNAIIVYSASAGQPASIKGHGLAQLWTELLNQIRIAGFSTDDEWTNYCGKLVNHIHEIDPDGERFRYPSNSSGLEFDTMSIDLQGLAVAQWHIGMLCEGAIGMLDALGRQT
jgi:hypothetical protein